MSTYRVDEQTVLAKQEELANRGRAKRFTDLVRAQETASRRGAQLSDEAMRSAADFERHVAELNELVDAEIDTLVPTVDTSFDLTSMTVSSDRVHVFGPGTFTMQWSHLDLGQTGVDVPNARFHARNYTTGPARFTVAQLGVMLRPSFPVCKLSVRAYVRYSGYDILSHRVHRARHHRATAGLGARQGRRQGRQLEAGWIRVQPRRREAGDAVGSERRQPVRFTRLRGQRELVRWPDRRAHRGQQPRLRHLDHVRRRCQRRSRVHGVDVRHVQHRLSSGLLRGRGDRELVGGRRRRHDRPAQLVSEAPRSGRRSSRHPGGIAPRRHGGTFRAQIGGDDESG